MENAHTTATVVFAMLAVTAPALVLSDLRERRLPNAITLALLVAGVVLVTGALAGPALPPPAVIAPELAAPELAGVEPAPWGQGLTAALVIAGGALAAGLLGVIGMGDAKLITAIALLVAPVHPLAPVLFLLGTVACGGVLAGVALVTRVRRGRGRARDAGQSPAMRQGHEAAGVGVGAGGGEAGLPYGVAVVVGGLASVLITGWAISG